MNSGSAHHRTAAAPDVVLAGAALTRATDELKALETSLAVLHLASIDDLLAMVEDREVACAVVDQSRPTESRGLKLALLAASRKVRHLIVLAPPGGRAEIEAIAGVHRVLRTPAAPRQVVDAIRDHLGTSHRPSGDVCTPGVASSAMTEEARSGPAARDRPRDWLRRLWSRDQTPRAPRRTAWQRFLPVASLAYKKLAMVILASLFALFLSYGTIIVFFLTSSGWSLPIELSAGHEMVLRAEKDLGEMKVRQNQVSQMLEGARSALAIAVRDEQDARTRLAITRQSIEFELIQQTRLLEETRTHVGRLEQILADFQDHQGNDAPAKELKAAYARRTITRKSLEAGTLAVIETRHRLATLSNELATRQIEADRIDARIAFLRSLRDQIGRAELQSLPAASSEFASIARDVIADQNVIAQAGKIIAGRSAEVRHLEDSLRVVQNNIDILLATPVGRAISTPVTVVFAPYENVAAYGPGTPLYRCAMLVMFCSRVGVTGETIPGETNAVHPLFGKPLRGVFVEAILEDKSDAQEELLHAGRPPLFF